jgi:hypothetical protein
MYHILSDTTTSAAPAQFIRDMATEEVRYLVDKSLSTDQGLNRFAWDFRSTGAWHSDARRRYQNGPLVPPGKYTATLTVGEWTATQTFELLPDPRLEKAGVTLEDLRKQADLQTQVLALLEAARKLEDELEKEVKQTRDESRLGTLKVALTQLQTVEGIYMEPKLTDQISYLNSMINRADQLPGQDAYERYEELGKQLRAIQESLDK